MKTWQKHIKVVIEALLAFYAASFCVGLFIKYRGTDWLVEAIILGILYLFVIIVGIRQIVKNLPMEAIMIAAPTVPLIALLMILTLIPIIHWI